MKKQYLIANWKMNLPENGIEDFAMALKQRVAADLEVVLAPPYPYLERVTALAADGRFSVAGQNCSEHIKGAYTGEVSGEMLREVGADSVIIGHSERRGYYGETDEMIGRKIAAAAEAGLSVVFCIGEKLEVREQGRVLAVLREQVTTALGTANRNFSHLTVAYEPVWAIGTGKNATSEEVREAHEAIDSFVTEAIGEVPRSILYGGSVKPQNAEELYSLDEVDGFLVGGASLVPDQFLAIHQSMRLVSSPS